MYLKVVLYKKRSGGINKSIVIQIFFPMIPVAKGRPRFTRQGHCYTPNKTIKFEVQIAMIASKAMKREKCEVFNTAIQVDLLITLRRPKTSKNEFPIVRPDADNFQKAIWDACNGIVWKDDCLICYATVEKRYGIPEGVMMSINSWEGKPWAR